MFKGTATTSFGSGKRENHDSSVFYNRKNSQSTLIDAEENITNESLLMLENWKETLHSIALFVLSDSSGNRISSNG